MPNLYEAFVTPSDFTKSLFDQLGYERIGTVYGRQVTTEDDNGAKHYDPAKLADNADKIVADCVGTSIVMTDVEGEIPRMLRYPPDPLTPKFWAAFGERLELARALKILLPDKIHVSYAFPGGNEPRYKYVDIITEHAYDGLMPVIYAKSSGRWRENVGSKVANAIEMSERTGKDVLFIISDRVVLKKGDVRTYYPVPEPDLNFLLDQVRGYDFCVWSLTNWRGLDHPNHQLPSRSSRATPRLTPTY